MPRFSVSEVQHLVLGLVLAGLVPFGVLVAASAPALGRRSFVARLNAAHGLVAWGARLIVAPALVLWLLVLIWAIADGSRAVNLMLTGALGGILGTLLFQLVLFAAHSAGLFPFNPVHRLGRLLLGFEARWQSVRAAGWSVLLLLGAAWGLGYGTLLGNSEWWWGPVAGLVAFLVGGLTPPIALAGGGPLLLIRNWLATLIYLAASLLYGVMLGAFLASFGTTRGLLVAWLASAGGG